MTKRSINQTLVLGLLLAWPAGSHAGELKPTSPIGWGYRLTWHDEFDGDRLDAGKWTYRIDTLFWSVQRAENVSVANGCLRLALKQEKQGEFEYTAGGVISRETFQYGQHEARFRCPPGAGWHTSFWMMRHNGRRAADEAAAVQEIDVCEQDSVNRTSYSVNLHRWKPGPHVSYGHKRITAPDLAAEFHVWGCEFTPQRIDWYFDGRLVQSLDATVIPHGPQNIPSITTDWPAFLARSNMVSSLPSRWASHSVCEPPNDLRDLFDLACLQTSLTLLFIRPPP